MKPTAPTRVIVFPFDQFGSAGTGAGAELVGDAIGEMLDDASEETVPHRAACYLDHVQISEYPFERQSDYTHWQDSARLAYKEALKHEERQLWLAGNHLALLPVYEELGADTLVLQFDAHLDVYNLQDCTEDLSHGNFLMHASQPLPKIINIGSRDVFLAPDHAAEYFHTIHSAVDIATHREDVLAKLVQAAKKAKRIWIDIDCDVFDPAYFPAVQHPQPFGLAPASVLGVLQTLWSEKIVGVSLSEFDPGRDRNDQSLATLIWLVEWFFLKWHGDSGR